MPAIDIRDEGLWWLPGNEDDTVAGTLTVAHGQAARLELIGAFGNLSSFTEDYRPEIIVGAAGGKLITLYRCTRVGARLQMPGLHTERYIADFVLRGAHFGSAADIRFASMAETYDALFEWASRTSFSVEFESETNGAFVSAAARLRFPEEIVYDVAGTKIVLTAAGEFEGGPRSQSIVFRQDALFEVRPPESLSLEDYHRLYFHDLSNLLAFAAGGAVRTTAVKGVLSADTAATCANSTRQVEVLYVGRGEHVQREWHAHEMLFSRADIAGELEEALRRWFSRADELRPIYDLYASTLFQEGAYVHQRFLSLAQALESYHRRAEGGLYISASQFADIRDKWTAVLSDPNLDVPADAQEALVGKLQHLNEVSFRQRLRKLLTSFGELTSVLIPDPSRFTARVVSTRNHYTHYDTASQEPVVDGVELSRLSDQMQFLLELCFLRELGFTKSIIEQLVMRFPRYQHLRRALQPPASAV